METKWRWDDVEKTKTLESPECKIDVWSRKSWGCNEASANKGIVSERDSTTSMLDRMLFSVMRNLPLCFVHRLSDTVSSSVLLPSSSLSLSLSSPLSNWIELPFSVQDGVPTRFSASASRSIHADWEPVWRLHYAPSSARCCRFMATVKYENWKLSPRIPQWSIVLHLMPGPMARTLIRIKSK